MGWSFNPFDSAEDFFSGALIPGGTRGPAGDALRDLAGSSSNQDFLTNAGRISRDAVEAYFGPLDGTVLPWEGGYYFADRNGFPMSFGYEVDLDQLFGAPNITTGQGGPATFFIGHMPDCEFDEVTLTCYGGDFAGPLGDPNPYYIGALVYQYRPTTEEKLQFVAVSGYELEYVVDDPVRIRREALKLRWRSNQRVSETYGGPMLAGYPTFVVIFADSNDGTFTAITPGVADWKVQCTVRFIMKEAQ